MKLDRVFVGGLSAFRLMLACEMLSELCRLHILFVDSYHTADPIPAPNVNAHRHRNTTSTACETDESEPKPDATAANMSMQSDIILKPASKDPRHPRYSKHQGVRKVPARMQQPSIKFTTNTFEIPTSCRKTVAYVSANWMPQMANATRMKPEMTVRRKLVPE